MRPLFLCYGWWLSCNIGSVEKRCGLLLKPYSLDNFCTWFVVLHSFCTLAIFTFWCQKVTKNWAVVYGIRCFLCSRVALQHLSVGAHLATRSLSQCLGRQELAALKHHTAYFQTLLGYSLCLPTLPFRPWRGITFCNDNALMHPSRTLAHTMVIPKKNRHCVNNSYC